MSSISETQLSAFWIASLPPEQRQAIVAELSPEQLKETRALIEAARAPMGFVLPDLVRIAVAIDPAATSGEDADETGIIVAGKDKEGRGYVLADLSGHHTPIEWARIAVAPIRATVPTGSSPRSITAARWSRRRCAWSTTTSPIPQCTPPAARWRAV